MVAGGQSVPERGETHGATRHIYDVGDSGIMQELAGPQTATAGHAHHVYGHRLAKHLHRIGNGTERHELRSGYMTLAILIRLAYVDDDASSLENGSKFCDGDFPY